MYPELLAHIKRYVQLESYEEQLLCDSIELKILKKKEYLLEAGKLCKGDYFIVKGCLRQFYINKKLNEQIINFGLENWWIADQDSLLNKQPSTTNIQAIEPSELLFLSEKNKIVLFEKVPRLESYFRIMMQKAFVASQRRIGYILTKLKKNVTGISQVYSLISCNVYHNTC